MRTTILILGLCLLALAIPATAEAHEETCWFGDVPCVVQCEAGHVVNPWDEPHECEYWW